MAYAFMNEENHSIVQIFLMLNGFRLLEILVKKKHMRGTVVKEISLASLLL